MLESFFKKPASDDVLKLAREVMKETGLTARELASNYLDLCDCEIASLDNPANWDELTTLAQLGNVE